VDRQAVHDFLASRRARITPAQVGMPTYGEKRRVPGLRREEVASLAKGELRLLRPARVFLDPYAKAFFLDSGTIPISLGRAVGDVASMLWLRGAG
jgi:hypothetical protein